MQKPFTPRENETNTSSKCRPSCVSLVFYPAIYSFFFLGAAVVVRIFIPSFL